MKISAKKLAVYILFVILCLCTMMGSMDAYADTTTGTFKLTWLRGTGNATIVDDTLNQQVTTRRNNSSVLRVQFSVGGDGEPIPEDGIEIRIPRYVYYDRNGKGVGEVVVPLSQTKNGKTNFYYRYSGNEIVIRNYAPIARSEFFTADIQYNLTNTTYVKDESSRAIQGSFTVTSPDGDTSQGFSNTLTHVFDSDIGELEAIGKEASQKYETWQSKWGEKPADADDYFYVDWVITVKDTPGTQPYTVLMSEDLGDIGELVAWRVGGSSSMTGTLEDFANTKFIELQERGFYGYEYGAYFQSGDQIPSGGIVRRHVIVKYNREEVKEAGGTVTNTVAIQKKGKDNTVIDAVATGTYTYRPVEIVLPYNKMDVVKDNPSTEAGGINRWENGETIEPDDTNNKPWELYITSTGMALTGITPDNINDYVEVAEDGTKVVRGPNKYTSILRDNQLQYKTVNSYAKRLTKDDYAFTDFYIDYIREYEAILDPDLGLRSRLRTDYTYADPVGVYVQLNGEQDWIQIGTVCRNGSTNTYNWTDMEENSRAVTKDSRVTLPDNVTGIEFRHTGNQYRVEMNVYVSTKFYPSTETLAQSEGMRKLVIYNYDLGRVINSDDRQVGSNTTYNEYHEFTRLIPESLMKKGTSYKTDYGNQKLVGNAYVYQYDYLLVKDSHTAEELIEKGIFKTHQSGVFYDLLPQGATVDVDTIQVYRVNRHIESTSTFNNLYDADSQVDYSVETIENYMRSGRTLIIVHVSTEDENVYKSRDSESRYLVSGFQLNYQMVYTKESVIDYGNKILNSAAYQSLDGDLADGRTDDGGTLILKDLMSDLDDNGANGDADKTFNYAQYESTLNSLDANEFGFSKRVKADGDTHYGYDATTLPGGEYSYQMRFQNDDAEPTSGVMMFDVLETAQSSKSNRWAGTFKSIDVSQLTAKGIDAKVYYSTSEAIRDLSVDVNWTDVSDTSIWSSTPPSDLSTVTAVAVDCRYDKNGKPYVFKLKETGVAFIYMDAPEDVDEYIDDPNTEEDETCYAFNSAYLNADDFDAPEECKSTTVKIRKPETEIHKNSNPESGTADSPAVLSDGDTLTYTLDVSNEEKNTDIYEVVVEDTIPTGLIIDTDNITYSYQDITEKVGDSDRIELEQSGQKLTFTIDSMVAASTGTITIPTRVADSEHKGLWLENTATLKSVGSNTIDEPSETTYHTTNTQAVVTKKWEDQENKFSTRPSSVTVQLYADGNAIEGKTADLTAQNEWSYTFEDLNAFDEDGNRITYSAKEVAVPGGYTSKADGLTVTNTVKLTESGDATLTIQKYRTGSTDPVEGAVFALRDATGAIKFTATTDEDGVASFTVQPNVKEESETYTLSEESAPKGYTPTSETWRVTFRRGEVPMATLNSDDIFEAVWNWLVEVVTDSSYADGVLTVYNDYQATGEITLEGSKILEGRALKANEFDFTVKEDGEVIASGKNTADGTIHFDTISYDFEDVGTHHYEVTEETGSLSGVTYDRSMYGVTVEVSDNGDGTLAVSATYPESGICFVNKYTDPNYDTDGDSEDDSDSSEEPDTGDDSDLSLWILLLLAGTAGAGFVARRRV